MLWTDDPIRDFLAWDAEQERGLASLPVCDRCHDPIQSDYTWNIGNEVLCERCAEDHRVDIEKIEGTTPKCEDCGKDDDFMWDMGDHFLCDECAKQHRQDTSDLIKEEY